MKVPQPSVCTKTPVGPPAARHLIMRLVSVFAILFSVCLGTAFAEGGDAQQAAWVQIDKGLKSGDFEHRRQSLVALATIDGSNPEAVNRVEAALHDSDARVRQQAALALGEMKAKSAIPSF